MSAAASAAQILVGSDVQVDGDDSALRTVVDHLDDFPFWSDIATP